MSKNLQMANRPEFPFCSQADHGIQGSLYYPFEGIKNCKCVGIWRISLTTVHCLGWQWKRHNDPRYILTLCTSRCRKKNLLSLCSLVNWWFEVVWGFPPTEAFLHFLEAQGEKPHTDTAAPKWVACLISGGGWNPGNLMLDIKPYWNLPVSMGFWTTPPGGSNPKGMVKKTVKKNHGNLFIPKFLSFWTPSFLWFFKP